MNDLWSEIEECLRLLELALKESGERGHKAVIAEADYYTQKTKTAFRLHEEGYPSTFINLVIKGMDEVAPKLREKGKTLGEYENAREARNVYKKKLDTLREQYQREWSQSGMKD